MKQKSDLSRDKDVSSKSVLTEGSIAQHLMRLSLPMSWGIMMIISFQLIDTYFISRLGTQELAAFSFTFPITYMVFTLIMGFSIAMSSVASRLIGSNEMDIVRRVVSHGLVMVFSISIIISILGLLFLEPLFRLLGADATMVGMIKEYMNIWFFGAVFVSLPMVGNSAMRAGGDAITPAIIMTLAAVMNVVLDPILIFGLLGAPALGLEGAAIATVIANGLALIAGLYVLHFKRKLICLKSLMNYSAFKDSAKRLCFIAIPAGLTNSIPPILNAVIVSLLAQISAESVAAFGVVTRIEAFAFIILMGLSVGMSPIIGQNFGAKKYDRVKKTIMMSVKFNVVWSLFIAVVLGLYAQQIASIFSTDSEVIIIAAMFFILVPFSYVLGNLINGWSSAFNAVGKPQRSVIMIFVKYVVMLLPAIHIGFNIDGARGIFIAIALVNIVSGAIFHIWSMRLINKACAE